MANLNWRKPSGCESGACVEVAYGEVGVWVKGGASINKDHSLLFSKQEWNVFIEAVRNGEFPPAATGLAQ